ncbi:hypothetical protein [Occallatibacter riparius]|uniref:Uncharacterized protein n=1 Tax=Occallatibacter riparius TaxID=1002689 RepID=A0A9J7BFH1_9BACT|nr:hypothetical protein [Occallatibacter riparius]UWZ81756.1 hypothetical protein MOP44_14295 [Occallatibacter riparius]
MAYYSIAGTGPVSFVDVNQNQLEIPLNQIFVTPNGVDASSWPHFGANATLVPALLAKLVLQGAVSASTTPATPPSLTATAAHAGTGGNSITISFSSPSPAAGTVTITVAAKEVYKDMTPALIGTTLGTSAGAAEGLVYVSDPGTGEMPGTFSGAISAGPDFNLAVPEAADSSKTAFTLAATSQDPAADAQLIKLDIVPDAGAPPTTFTLTVSWTKTQTDVKLSSLSATNPFAYLVTFSGQSGPLPAAGSITLKGGAAGHTASASLLS